MAEEKEPTCGPNAVPDNHKLRGRYSVGPDGVGRTNPETASRDEGWKAATAVYAAEVGPESQANVARELIMPSRVNILAIMQSYGIHQKDAESHNARADTIRKMIADAAVAAGLWAEDAEKITAKSVLRTIRYKGTSRTWKRDEG